MDNRSKRLRIRIAWRIDGSSGRSGWLGGRIIQRFMEIGVDARDIVVVVGVRIGGRISVWCVGVPAHAGHIAGHVAGVDGLVGIIVGSGSTTIGGRGAGRAAKLGVGVIVVITAVSARYVVIAFRVRAIVVFGSLRIGLVAFRINASLGLEERCESVDIASVMFSDSCLDSRLEGDVDAQFANASDHVDFAETGFVLWVRGHDRKGAVFWIVEDGDEMVMFRDAKGQQVEDLLGDTSFRETLGRDVACAELGSEELKHRGFGNISKADKDLSKASFLDLLLA